MKTSFIFIVLILINTTALIAEPITQLIRGVNTWLFVVIEGMLFVGFFINKMIKNMNEAIDVDFNNIKLFN